MFRILTSRQLAFDIVVAVLCLVLRLTIGVGEVPTFFVAFAMAAALALRRVSPGLALAVAWLGSVFQVASGLQPDISNLAILAVLYSTACYGAPRLKWLGLASSGLGAAVIAVYIYAVPCRVVAGNSCSLGGQIPATLLSLAAVFFFFLVVFVLSWTFGLLAKTWRKARESSVARIIAEQLRVHAEQLVVVEQERNRIARDMHDVVAHSLAVVIAQADGARYAAHEDPGAVDTALTTIASTARQALGEVRVLLAQLRHSQGDAPQPAFADLERLFAQLRASGLRIDFSPIEPSVELAAGQQLAVYRIVQEALTNALRHGNVDKDVVVRFEWSAESITVQVSNAVVVRSDDTRQTTTGHGLAGMRERAALWGGTFDSGVREGGNYVVKAVLPIHEIGHGGV